MSSRSLIDSPTTSFWRTQHQGYLNSPRSGAPPEACCQANNNTIQPVCLLEIWWRQLYYVQLLSEPDWEFQGLTFSERFRSIHDGELLAIKSSDLAFYRFVNYCYYWLSDTTVIPNAEDSRKLWEQVETIQATFASKTIRAEHLVLFFDFLFMFVEKADYLGVFEAYSILIFPRQQNGQPEQYIRSLCDRARSIGSTCWLEVVEPFLRTYAATTVIRNAVNDLQNIRPLPRKDKIS